jgi:hypothetical protein
MAQSTSKNDRMAQFIPNNNTGRPPFVFGAFGGSVNARVAQFTLKTAQDARHLFLKVFRGPFSDRGGVFFYCWRLVGLQWPVKFFADVAPKGVMLFC